MKMLRLGLVVVWTTLMLTVVMMQELIDEESQSEEGDLMCSPIYPDIFCLCDHLSTGFFSTNCYVLKDFKQDDDRWKRLKASKKLESLHLYSKPEGLVTNFPTAIMEPKSPVKIFSLNQASLNSIPSMAFQNSTNVREIDLSSNNINMLESYAFAFLPSLEVLILNHNNLTIIKRNTFKGTSLMKYLHLADNKLDMLEDGVFSDLHSLEELHLTNNLLTDLKSNTFKGLSRLIRLELGNNNIRILKNQVFSGLANVQVLDLRENQIEMIDPTAFNGASNILRLYLNRNKLVELDDNTFKSQRKLMYLDLRWNNLETLTENTLSHTALFNLNMSFHVYILVSGNQFICDCRIQWMLKMVKLYDDKKYRPSTREWSNITCSPLLQVSQVDNEFQGSTETVQDDTTNAVVKDDFNVQAIEGHSGSVMKALFLNDASSYLEICPPVKNDTKSVKAHQNSDVQSYSFLHNASGKCTNLSSIITMTIHLCIIWQFLVMSDGI